MKLYQCWENTEHACCCESLAHQLIFFFLTFCSCCCCRCLSVAVASRVSWDTRLATSRPAPPSPASTCSSCLTTTQCCCPSSVSLSNEQFKKPLKQHVVCLCSRFLAFFSCYNFYISPLLHHNHHHYEHTYITGLPEIPWKQVRMVLCPPHFSRWFVQSAQTETKPQVATGLRDVPQDDASLLPPGNLSSRCSTSLSGPVCCSHTLLTQRRQCCCSFTFH